MLQRDILRLHRARQIDLCAPIPLIATIELIARLDIDPARGLIGVDTQVEHLLYRLHNIDKLRINSRHRPEVELRAKCRCGRKYGSQTTLCRERHTLSLLGAVQVELVE